MLVKMPTEISSSFVKNILKVSQLLVPGNDLVLDWSSTKQIDVAGYSILSTLLDLAIESQCSLDHRERLPILKHPIFSKHNVRRLDPNQHKHEDETSINLCLDGGFSPLFATYFADKFSTTLSQEVIFHGQLIINELLQNATDHSGSERYYFYAEVFNQTLFIGLLDSGIGIPAKMAQKYVKDNDDEYIDYSFKEGISTRRLRSGGYGLFHTFNIVKKYEGNLIVLSHAGGIRRYFAQRKVTRLKLQNPVRGTWCFLEIKFGEIV